MQRRTLWRPWGRIFALILALSFLTTIMVAVPAVGFAQDVESELQQALTAAVDDYDVLQIQDAEKRLEDAIKLADKSRYSGPALAKIWAMLGVVRFAATRDEAITEDAFVAAVENDPKVELDPNYATPTLEELMKRARKRAKPSGTATNTSSEKNVSMLTHTPIATADAGKNLEFEALVPADMPVYRMFAMFKRFDESNYSRVEMKPTSKTRFAATIDGSEVRTSQMDYFIFAEDRGGEIIARVGSDTEPLNIVVLGSGDLEAQEKTSTPEQPNTSHKWVYVTLMGGTGAGFVSGTSATANPEVETLTGIASTIGHALLDVGVSITDNVQLGLFFRYQFAPTQDFADIVVDTGDGFWNTEEECLGLGLPGDCIVGLKYKWFFQNTEHMRAYSSIGGGVGRVRNWIKVPKDASIPLVCDGREIVEKDGIDVCYLRDTTRTGWAHFGAGGGLAFPMTENIDLNADLYLMLLVPTTSFNGDISLGVTFRF